MDTDFHKIYNNPRINNDIAVENNIWIGCKNIILKEVLISNMIVMGSNLLV